MWYWLVARAKPHATPQTIAAKRYQWITQGKDQELSTRCRSAQRYVVEQRSPPTVFWLLEADDSHVVSLITDHFGDLWDIEIHRVAPQAISQVVRREPS